MNSKSSYGGVNSKSSYGGVGSKSSCGEWVTRVLQEDCVLQGEWVTEFSGGS